MFQLRAMWLLSLLIVFAMDGTLAQNKQMTHKEVRQFFANATYDGADPPALDKPTAVRIGFYVNSLDLKSEGVMVLSMYFRTSWQDERLKAMLSNEKHRGFMIKDPALIEKVWKPDLFFRNSDKSDRVNALTHEALLKVNGTGHVWFVTKLVVSARCPHISAGHRTLSCPIMIESFGYTMDTIYFRWLDSPVDVDRSVNLNSHILKDTILYDCSQNYTAGAFPCLEVRFILTPDYGASFYRTVVYIISMLLVIIAWFSFWIPPSEMRILLELGCTVTLSVFYLVVSGWTEYTFKHEASHGQGWLGFCTCLVLIMLLVNFILSMPNGCILMKFDKLRGREMPEPPADMEHKRTRITEIVEGVFCLILVPLAFIVAVIWFSLTK